MNPYRQYKDNTFYGKKDTIFNKLKNKIIFLYRKRLITLYGAYKKRFPVKCPKCNKRSWDPETQFKQSSKIAGYKINYYRCGHKFCDKFTYFLS